MTNAGRGPVANLAAEVRTHAPIPMDLGEFDISGPGVTLPAGETRGIDVRFTVDDRMADLGTMKVTVVFGAPPWGAGSTETSAVARVPGRRVLPNAKVHLRDQVTGEVIARDITDGEGRFGFFDVPVGLYTAGVVGPDQPDPDQPPSTTPPAATPPAGSGPGQQLAEQRLAETGAGVTWLALGGLLTLAAGAGLVTGRSAAGPDRPAVAGKRWPRALTRSVSAKSYPLSEVGPQPIDAQKHTSPGSVHQAATPVTSSSTIRCRGARVRRPGTPGSPAPGPGRPGAGGSGRGPDRLSRRSRRRAGWSGGTSPPDHPASWVSRRGRGGVSPGWR
ncbi:carboxypeptidase-like regulatory domain-containing protein [Saccharothrix syringae]|uniref:carboxypeptidase-like regulatory domain-containing protein n=1 Tax=Saccharothrix syringae TaxID=103733 RepID=UPI0012931221|nr:carboxypeptidase-like regulatory domain-containing protein [Saccharothrix syringae]